MMFKNIFYENSYNIELQEGMNDNDTSNILT
jgi:hypothetical protein